MGWDSRRPTGAVYQHPRFDARYNGPSDHGGRAWRWAGRKGLWGWVGQHVGRAGGVHLRSSAEQVYLSCHSAGVSRGDEPLCRSQARGWARLAPHITSACPAPTGDVCQRTSLRHSNDTKRTSRRFSVSGVETPSGACPRLRESGGSVFTPVLWRAQAKVQANLRGGPRDAEDGGGRLGEGRSGRPID